MKTTNEKIIECIRFVLPDVTQVAGDVKIKDKKDVFSCFYLRGLFAKNSAN